jgi:hypothetical protein
MDVVDAEGIEGFRGLTREFWAENAEKIKIALKTGEIRTGEPGCLELDTSWSWTDLRL